MLTSFFRPTALVWRAVIPPGLVKGSPCPNRLQGSSGLGLASVPSGMHVRFGSVPEMDEAAFRVRFDQVVQPLLDRFPKLATVVDAIWQHTNREGRRSEPYLERVEGDAKFEYFRRQDLAMDCRILDRYSVLRPEDVQGLTEDEQDILASRIGSLKTVVSNTLLETIPRHEGAVIPQARLMIELNPQSGSITATWDTDEAPTVDINTLFEKFVPMYLHGAQSIQPKALAQAMMEEVFYGSPHFNYLERVSVNSEKTLAQFVYHRDSGDLSQSLERYLQD